MPRRLALAVDGDDFALVDNHDIVQQLLDALQGTLALVSITDQNDPEAPARQRARHSVRASGLVPVPEGSLMHVRYHADIADGILQSVAALEADLLVVVARRHSLLGGLFHHSVTARLISESPVPVLLLPALG